MSDPVMSIAARGEGRTASGRFVAGAAPGDWLDAAGVLHHGPAHQPAACRHFSPQPAGGCGGCQLQHVSDAAYARWMVDRIGGAIEGQGLPLPAIREPHLSPARTRRRVSLKALRRGQGVLIGFHAGGSHRLIDLGECPVMAPPLWALVDSLRALLARLLPPRGSGTVQMTLADQGVDVLIGGARADSLAAHEAMGEFARTHALARLSIDQGDGPETQWEPEPATARLNGIAVGLPHGAFMQATADGEAALVAAVQETLADMGSVADLFAGIGTFTLALANGRTMLAAEGSRSALTALQLAANRHQLRVRGEHRDLYRRPFTARELADFAGVVIDPPRAGAEAQVSMLAASTVQCIAYVSCNPASFARDARILAEGGYRIAWVQPVGQFRWSTHMELAACLSRQ